MAFISHNVYNKGIENTILNNSESGENAGYVFLALLNKAFVPNDQNSGEVVFEEDKILAFSELRRGSGNIANINSNELTSDEVSNTINKLGKFDKKVLSLFPIAFNRTVSRIGQNSGSSAAGFFALIKYKGTGKPITAYSMDTEEIGSDGLPVQKDVCFLGPDFSDKSKFEVYLIGELSTTPTINQNSNFMFGGATITFKEAQ